MAGSPHVLAPGKEQSQQSCYRKEKGGAGLSVGTECAASPGASGRESVAVLPAVTVTVASAGAYPASCRRIVWVPAGMPVMVTGVIRSNILPSIRISAPGGLVLTASFPVLADGGEGVGVVLSGPPFRVA
ncbi:hypothetical protein [Methanogenium cariaci]|uniref:hypothetical protein n=1 Tax=Methanogenium cariaci TaxID=2197 RepID=UPI001FDEF4D0|nr:hypothetical protein [Methanogenium cariaci]